MNSDPHYIEQIQLAQQLLKTVRHAAYATVNEDGLPHNSPLKLIYDDTLTKLYIGSYSDSRHIKNLGRTGKTFVAIYDAFTKGQGGLYITGTNGHECSADELPEALRVHNKTRERDGSTPIDISYYKTAKPSQRMYAIDIAKIELYSVVRDKNGMIAREARIAVKPEELARGL